MSHSRPLFRLFSSLQINIFPTKRREKCPSSIHCWDSNPRPSQYDSPPIATWQGLLASTLATISDVLGTFQTQKSFNATNHWTICHLALGFEHTTTAKIFSLLRMALNWKNILAIWSCLLIGITPYYKIRFVAEVKTILSGDLQTGQKSRTNRIKHKLWVSRWKNDWKFCCLNAICKVKLLP